MIARDLNFDPVEEKKQKKKDPRGYQRRVDDRTIVRQREREADQQDVRRYQQELAEFLTKSE